MADLVLWMDEPDRGAGGTELSCVIERARAGDLAAFERLVREYEQLVFRTALRLLGRVEDAQDAAQETFLRLHRNLDRFKPGRELAPWLYTITVNICRDIRRRRPAAAPDSFEVEDTAPGPHDELAEAERRRILAQGLESLPEKQRAAVVLRDIEGLPTREVAHILGASEATVRSHVSAARLKLKRFADGFGKRRS